MTIHLEQYQSGQYQKDYEYRYFLPSSINDEWVWQTPQINRLLEKAAVKLGELNSFARLVLNTDLFIQLHVTKEAVVSSRIEGTQTDMREAVLPESEISPEHRNDWHEVQNYTQALNQAISDLQALHLSSAAAETNTCNFITECARRAQDARRVPYQSELDKGARAWRMRCSGNRLSMLRTF
ncbi:Fic/DOC family N-terminal domain-containing protein [Nitrosomonas ureae]|nr:Fic/DOC family N-terminal domain-containing protein [Nitrosomonas ureae]